MSRGRGTAVGWAAPALALVALLVSGVAVLVQQTAVVVHGCVEAGAFGPFGVHLSLLRPDASCPAGGYAVGDGQRIVGVVVAVALPVLLAHLVGALVGAGLASRLHRVVRTALAAVLRHRTPRREPVALPVVSAVPVDVPVHLPRPREVPGGPWWRGPPVVGVA